jgi:membrane dipeptidase
MRNKTTAVDLRASTMKKTHNLKRRSLLRTMATSALAFPMINIGAYQVFAASDKKYSDRAIDLVNTNQVVDMLSVVFPFGQVMTPPPTGISPKANDSLRISKAYMQLLLSSGIDVFHPAMGLRAAGAAVFIARLNALVAEHPDHLRRIDSVDDFKRLSKGQRIGVLIGVQNSDHFQEVDDVNKFYHLGQRVSQLTYNTQNLIGSGATDRIDGGLSDYGVRIVQRMNALGMAVDVSHCGDQTTLDAFELSVKPVLISHSNARALVDGHIRCKSDEAIKAMAKSGGVMGITGVRNFVSNKEPTSIEQLIDHIDYTAKLVGIEHVGVGSDMDMHGYDAIPEPYLGAMKKSYSSSYGFRDKLDTDGFDHPQRIFDLTDGLIRRGYTNEDIELVLGRNFKRVLTEIWLT